MWSRNIPLAALLRHPWRPMLIIEAVTRFLAHIDEERRYSRRTVASCGQELGLFSKWLEYRKRKRRDTFGVFRR